MNPLILLLPLILTAVGFAFIVLAVNDKVDARPDDGSARLPTRRERPLYRLHMQIRSTGKPPSAARASGPTVTKRPKQQQ